MGAWSHEPFGNDTACDWSYELLETEDLSAVEAALDEVLEAGGGYLEADLGSQAVAAWHGSSQARSASQRDEVAAPGGVATASTTISANRRSALHASCGQSGWRRPLTSPSQMAAASSSA